MDDGSWRLRRLWWCRECMVFMMLEIGLRIENKYEVDMTYEEMRSEMCDNNVL